MTLSELQQQVGRFVEEHGLDATIEIRLLDLVSEVGELAKEPLKVTAYGRVPFVASAAWADELGDVLFALTCLANATGVDMHAALESALKKYERRIDERGTAGSSPSG
jgi:NTP pyrophosphatase (non-canonical NTP hydrolase)